MDKYKQELFDKKKSIDMKINIIKEVCQEGEIEYSNSIVLLYLKSQQILVNELIRSCFKDDRFNRISRGEDKKLSKKF